MSKAIIYTRFSPRPNVADCDSCEKQYERCKAFCTANGIDFFHEYYIDKGVSGDGLDCRPVLQVAIESLGSGDHLVVSSNDRLARDSLAYLTIQSAVKAQGATILFADGSPPETTPEGVLFQSILAAFATYQRSVTKQRTSVGVKKALAKRKAEGKHQGKPPFGWGMENGNLVREPREQMILNFIRQERHCRAETLSNTALAERVNKEFGGLRTKPATAGSIRKLIRKYIS